MISLIRLPKTVTKFSECFVNLSLEFSRINLFGGRGFRKFGHYQMTYRKV